MCPEDPREADDFEPNYPWDPEDDEELEETGVVLT